MRFVYLQETHILTKYRPVPREEMHTKQTTRLRAGFNLSRPYRAWYFWAIYPGRRSPTRSALGYPILPFQGGENLSHPLDFSNVCFHRQAPLRSVGPVAQRDGQVARTTLKWSKNSALHLFPVATTEKAYRFRHDDGLPERTGGGHGGEGVYRAGTRPDGHRRPGANPRARAPPSKSSISTWWTRTSGWSASCPPGGCCWPRPTRVCRTS